MTVDEAKRVMLEALGRKFGEGEARSLTGIIFEELMHYSAVDVLLRGGHDLPEVIDGELPKVLGRLLANEPVQYVFGVAEFHGHRFKVTPATLIPRPETAELVDMIVDEHKEAADLRVLDIGTGSGCIAVSLARALKYAEVYALDISEAALEVAAENARELKTRVKFFKSDVLKSSQLPVDELDIIVSNPPYICEEEKVAMDGNVLDYEPHGALFVPNDEPLLFYRAIARQAAKSLRPGGRLYLEINSRFAEETRQMLESEGFAEVEVHLDFYSRPRFITSSRDIRYRY